MTDGDRHSVAGTVGGVAGKMVESFGGAPALLAIVILNVAMLASAMWVMESRENLRAESLTKVLALLEKCLK